MKLSIVLLSLLLSSVSFASWSEDFENLKDIPRSYEDAGAICEEVARLDMMKEYPAPQYDVVVGIAYGDVTRTIGELDVVIVDNNIQKVIKIAEVKCWKDLNGGLRKARDQRARFLKNLNSSKALIFRSTATKQVWDARKFEQVRDFISIAQKGSTKQGFDQELEYTLQEMHQHRTDMMRCQKDGLCAKP